ncbi:MAG TPA: rhomboid family intramembrane serine protease, partial [Gemmataceae bacterium]|nr:rhomboid family intramembrane serine protease [Gemmataceae bacterium]
MLLIFPYRTDAPMYHFPFATIGLIVVNVVTFFALGIEKEYILEYGHGLQPAQWVTSNFVHGSFLHLLGNMIALWTFGLLVEGKVGPLVFLPLYLAIGAIQCGVEQAVMLGADGGSFGASAIIFALMAISFVWAPKNDVGVFGLVVVRPVEFDLPIVVFSGLLFVWEFVQMSLVGFRISTALLHMSGALVGFGVGILFLKCGWV